MVGYLLENPCVAILVRDGRDCFQIKGVAEYKTSGRVYQEAVKWMRGKGSHYPAKGVVLIKTEEFYDSRSGPRAGQKYVSK